MMDLVLESGFVGRERECATLSAALAHGPALVLIEGEAGIGKTRLLREVLITRNDDRRANLLAGCPPFRTPHTLAPIVDAVRACADQVEHLRLSPLAGALRPLFPEWAADLPPAPEPLDDIRAARYRLFRALLELRRCLDVSVLAVEDLHWAADATLEFLLFLTNRRPFPLSVVVTYRPEELPHQGAGHRRRRKQHYPGPHPGRQAHPGHRMGVARTPSLAMIPGWQDPR